jgi:lipopolysaccharide export system permease protein
VRILDRYVLRRFLSAYLFCIAAFFSIWLVFDISDNASVFIDLRIPVLQVAGYYLSQVPQVTVLLLPIALLLSLLFSLGRMSRANEIVSMLTSGVSVTRLILPLLIVGLVTTLVSTAFNYSLAAQAEFSRATYFDTQKVYARDRGLRAQIFRNRVQNRTWYIQQANATGNEFRNVQILQHDEENNIVTSYMAPLAVFRPETQSWDLREVRIVTYDNAGNIVHEENAASRTMTGWSETPFRLRSANMNADYMGRPELREYLDYNADFPPAQLAPFATHYHYRLALPWSCFVVVLIAAPLAIGFSRSGILASVASAILLVFAMNFMNHLFVALGEGARVAPAVAAWLPNTLFGAVGLVLLYLRSTNRDVRSLNPFARRVIA